MDLNQLLRQSTEGYEHFLWINVAIAIAALVISAWFAFAMYGLCKQVCDALARWLNAKASVDEDEFRKRQAWQTPARPGQQGDDAKYRPTG